MQLAVWQRRALLATAAALLAVAAVPWTTPHAPAADVAPASPFSAFGTGVCPLGYGGGAGGLHDATLPLGHPPVLLTRPPTPEVEQPAGGAAAAAVG